MPRIRKKTSKRVATHQREKIKHKISEGRKKSKKAAKKNPQWKSKKKQDPGVPNNFPFKDEIIAEVAEARRQDLAEKQRRKEEAKKAKATLKAAPVDNDESSGSEADDEPSTTEQDTGIIAVAGSKAVRANGKRNANAMDEDEVPTLVDPTLNSLAAAVERADALVCVLDARDPLPCRSTALEGLGKPCVFVVTKIDLVPRECTAAWSAFLRSSSTSQVVLFRPPSAFLPTATPTTATATASRKPPPTLSVSDAIGADTLLSVLRKLGAKTVAVVGPSNVGKSTLINSLARQPVQTVYDLQKSLPGASTTTVPVTVQIGDLSFIDTAGFVALYANAATEEAERARDMLVRSRGRIERVKDPLVPIQELLPRAPTEDLMLLYNLPAFEKGSTTAFLTTLARARHCLTKDATPDHTAAARIVLRDWNSGAFARYTLPDGISTAPSVDPQDAAALDSCLPRKDLRRLRGSLVRLNAGEIDARQIDMNARPTVSGESDLSGRPMKKIRPSPGDDEDEDADQEDDAMSTDGDEEEESGYESDNNDTPAETASRKRVAAPRKESKATKRVSFAPVARVSFAPSAPKLAKTGKGQESGYESDNNDNPAETSSHKRVAAPKKESKATKQVSFAPVARVSFLPAAPKQTKTGKGPKTGKTKPKP